MKTRNIVAGVILLMSTLTLYGCQFRIDTEGVSGDRVLMIDGPFAGKRIIGCEETCTMVLGDLKAFESIRLDGNADIEYQQSTDGTTEVVVTVAENLADLVAITSEHGTLSVGYTDKYNRLIISNSKLKVVVRNPHLSHVVVNGSGDVLLKGNVSSKELTLKINGSGDINAMALSCERVAVSINGSGDVDLAGNADNAVLTVNGSGDIDAEHLICKNVEAAVVGSGDIDCHASEVLDAKVTGSGDITYSGDGKVTTNKVRRK